ncbi:hypothetical protein ABIA39_007418 [Nocardia sp. GAS34]
MPAAYTSASVTPGAAASTLPLTTRVQTAFGARAVGLDDAATALLLIAATEETGRLEIVLAAAAAYHAGPAELTRVEDSGLLVRHDDRITFRHPLARAAVLGAAPAHRRMEAHRALATALALCGTIEADDRAAWHRAAAATGPDDDIAAALEAAASRASDRGDHALAAAAMERAGAMTVDPVGGTRRLTCAAKAAAAAGDLRRTAALVRRAARGPLDERDAPHLDHLRAIVESEFGSRRHAARMLIDTADRAPADLAGTMLVDAIRNGVLVGDPELTERAATMLQRRRGRTPISEGMIGMARMLGGPGEPAQGLRPVGDFGCTGEEILIDEGEPGAPGLRFAGVVETRRSGDAERLDGGVIFHRPRREPRIAVQGNLAGTEMACENAGQDMERGAGQEGYQPLGDDHGRTVTRYPRQPTGGGDVRTDEMGRLRQEFRTQGDHVREVDVIPIDSGRRLTAMHPGIEPTAQIQHHRIGMRGSEHPDGIVQFPAAKGRFVGQAVLDLQSGEVVVDPIRDFRGAGVAP